VCDSQNDRLQVSKRDGTSSRASSTPSGTTGAGAVWEIVLSKIRAALHNAATPERGAVDGSSCARLSRRNHRSASGRSPVSSTGCTASVGFEGGNLYTTKLRRSGTEVQYKGHRLSPARHQGRAVAKKIQDEEVRDGARRRSYSDEKKPRQLPGLLSAPAAAYFLVEAGKEIVDVRRPQ